MASSPLTDIALASATLKGVAGHQFQQLCDALRALEAQAITELAAADGNDVYRVQGKFKIVRQLRKHFVECVELRETFIRRSNDGRPSTQPAPRSPGNPG